MPVLSLISRETDEHGFIKSEKYVTERGLELSICPTPGGLYEIVTHGGGNPPTICGDRFTSHLKAKEELTKYIVSTDRLGYAIYPDKKEEDMRQNEDVQKMPRRKNARKLLSEGEREEKE